MSSKRPIGYNSARKKAERLKGNPQKTKQILGDAYSKARKKKGTLTAIWGDLMALFRLATAWQKGHYKDISWKSIASVLGALIYFLSPIDVVPDFIPLLGYLDDVTIIAYVVKRLSTEIDAFQKWESNLNEVTIVEEL